MLFHAKRHNQVNNLQQTMLSPESRWSLPAFAQVLLLAGCFFLCSPVSGEDDLSFNRHFVLTNWESEQGQPFLAITCMAQTPDGYFWVGSYDGLAKFDGVRFEKLSQGVFGSEDILVLSMVVDPAGTLWVGTSEGIWRRKAQSWTQFTPASELVYSLSCDSKGKVIALAGNDLLSWTGERFEILPPPVDGPEYFSHYKGFFDTEDRFWLSGRFSIFMHDGEHWTNLHRRSWDERLTPHLMGAGPARDGGIWYAERDVIHHYKDGAITKSLPRIPGHINVEATFWEDASGMLWEAGERNGLVVHRPGKEPLVCKVADGLANNALLTISPDREGNVWLGSDGGGMTMVRQRTIFTHADQAFLSQRLINVVVEVAPDKLLIGTHGGGALYLENGQFSAPITTEGNRRLDAQSWVQAVVQDAGGALWIGAYQHGLHRFHEGEHQHWGYGHFGTPHVYSLHIDDAGDLWLGTVGRLMRMEGEDFIPQSSSTQPWGVVHMIESDDAGGLWVANHSGNLWTRSGEDFRQVTEINGQPLGLVRYLHRDENRTLWITTDQDTVWWQNGNSWQRLDASNGLPAGEWKPLAMDTSGNHWFGSDRGVMRVSRQSLDEIARQGAGALECQVFNQLDGMETSRVRSDFQDIGVRSSNGSIWFATIKGVGELDPSHLAPPPPRNFIHIEKVGDGDQVLLNMPGDGETVVIPAGTERVNIYYSSPSTSHGDYISYAYQLVGVDDTWIHAGKERMARLTDLQPGDYTFRVQAIGLDSRIQAEASVSLSVTPLWWQRGDVRVLALLTLLGLVTYAVAAAARVRHRRQRFIYEQKQVIAEQRHRRREAEHEVELAQASNQAKRDFLATMSHEIRNPLNGVIGSVDLLGNTPLRKEEQRYMTTLRASAEALLSLLNDILDFSKIEAGKVSLEVAPFDLHEALAEVMEVAVPKALAKKVELALIVFPEVPILCLGDELRLRQMLINLVNNALKFTDQGTIILQVEPVDPDHAVSHSEHIDLRFSVQDTGIGIPAHLQDQLFESFTQASTSTARNYGGTGLGLSICKHLVELMGGHIGLNSEDGRGAEFFFEIPLTIATAPEPVLLEIERPVFVLDDNPASLRATTTALARCGVSAEGSTDPVELLPRLMSALASETGALLLLDDSSTDGLTTEQVENLNRGVSTRRLTVILMASRPRPQADVPPFSVADTLRKPLLHIQDLRDVLDPSAAKATAAGAAQTTPDLSEDAQACAHHVLLADDEPVNRIVLAELLRQLGCSVDVAENGAEAVDLARTRAYALIFMDCRMPEMDGFTAAGEILRSVPDAPPIIAISADTSIEDRDRCTEAGMSDFVSKPARRTELQEVITRWT